MHERQEQRSIAAATRKVSARTLLARADEVFFEVAPLAPRDRDDAIRRLCAGDDLLEREVRSLVASAAQIGSYLEQPAMGSPFNELRERADDAADELLGASLGAFRVERRLASGGMGTVYLATRVDGQFEQNVAIKVVKRGMDSEEILARFRTERQTLAALDHPNIARLLDGGLTPDGRPFVVMEYVEGQPIDAYCDERGLGLRERLALFRTVCAGVQHAHQNLVIHRDLKPSNILVTAQGVPKLLDFGIAKVLDGGTGAIDRAGTTDSQRRLTPEYASPEQVHGSQISTASDVYSLGVILYELLTGVRPYQFRAKTWEEVQRVVCTVVPPLASEAVTVRAARMSTSGLSDPLDGATRIGGMTSTRLRGRLRGDIDTIVGMALRKEPHRRYVSAEQLSADVDRFLNELPVQARRDTIAYRTSKFVRRHAGVVAAVVAAFVLLSSATLVLWRQRVELARRGVELAATNARLDEQVHRLDENRRFLQMVIRGADTGREGPDARLGDVLRAAAESLRRSPPSDPLTRAAAQEEMGRAMMSLGLLTEARELLDAAMETLRGLPPDAPARIDAEINWGELLFHEEKYDQAEIVFRELLGRALPDGGKHNERSSTVLNNLGSTVRALGRTEEAIELQREALAATISALGPASLETAETRNNLASALFQNGEYGEATKEFEQALSARRALLRADHPLVIRCQSNLGLSLLRSGRPREAIELLRGAADLWESAFGPEHPGRVPTIISLGLAYRAEKRPDDAVIVLRRALAWQSEHQAQQEEQVAATEAHLGLALAEAKIEDEAIASLGHSVRVLKPASPLAKIRGEALTAVVRLLSERGEESAAEEFRRQME